MQFKRHTALCGALLGCLAWTLGGMPARAIQITFTIDNPQNNPWYDPAGNGLASIATAAATIWESLRPGDETYHWNIHWEDYDDGNSLAVANSIDGSIKFRTSVMWFIDPTPLENEEFGPFQSFYVGNLDAATNDLWFAGSNPPAALEYGYVAPSLGGGPAAGQTDLLTVMLHEMGHLSGIGWNALVPDVPIPPEWIGFRPDIKVKRENEAHIMPDEALMDPTYTGGRALPSALDVMVAAHEKGAATVHLDRVDFIGNALLPFETSWSTPLNWVGGQAPDAQQVARIGFGHDVTSLLPGQAKALEVFGGASLAVHGALDIGTDATIRDEGMVTVGPTGALHVADTLTLTDDLSVLHVEGGQVTTKNLQLLGAAQLRGHGQVSIHENFSNGGSIRGEGGTLYINTADGFTLDLDGPAQNGHVEALTGNVEFGTGVFNFFRGSLWIGEGHSIHFADTLVPLVFQTEADLAFLSGANAGQEAVLKSSSASDLILRGTTFVGVGVHAVIEANSIEFPDSNTLDVQLDGTLDLRGPTYFPISSVNEADGNLVFNGTVTIGGSVTLKFNRIDLDGYADNNLVHVEPNARLNITAAALGNGNRFEGDMLLEGGGAIDFDIDTFGANAWTQAGHIDMSGSSKLLGSRINHEGTIEVTKGLAHIATDIALRPGSTIQLNGEPESFVGLNLRGDHIHYEGGLVTTSSGMPQDTLVQTLAKATVTGDTTIIAGYFNWDGSGDTDSSTRIAPQTTLAIRTGKIGSPDAPVGTGSEGFGDTIDLDSGVLDVLIGSDNHGGYDLPNFWSITEKGTLNLNRALHSLPVVKGSRLVNHGTISGLGQFFNPLDNLGEIFVGHEGDAGIIELFNDFHQSEAGTLYFELGGLLPGDQHDQIRSDGVVFLAGILNVSLIYDFVPASGDWFRLIDAMPDGKIMGEFSAVILPEVEGQWHLMYGDTFVDLRLVAVPEPAALALALVAVVALAPYLHRRRRKAHA